MKLRQLFESSRKAVMTFGRMNPPTIGHQKLVEAVKSHPGDHYVFLSQTQKPKTDPLGFTEKLRYAKFFFPEVTLGHPKVKTPIQALQMIQELGYDEVIFVAGSDRVEGFQKLFDTYNGQPDKSGNVPFSFKSIEVVSAGERDPDADGAEGMSASKMRQAAADGNLEAFSEGTPRPELAEEMFAAVRQGMGVMDAVPAEGVQEENNILDPLRGAAAELFGEPEVSQIPPEEIAILQAMEKYKDDPAGLKDWIMKDVDIRHWLSTDGSYLVDKVKSHIKGKPKTEASIGSAINFPGYEDEPKDKNKNKKKKEKSWLQKAKELAGLGEDTSGEEEDEFHKKLDKLVHKTFGHSSDEKKKKKSKSKSRLDVESIKEENNMQVQEILKSKTEVFLDRLAEAATKTDAETLNTAIRDFQTKAGIQVDGKVGPATRKAFQDAMKNTGETPPDTTDDARAARTNAPAQEPAAPRQQPAAPRQQPAAPAQQTPAPAAAPAAPAAPAQRQQPAAAAPAQQPAAAAPAQQPAARPAVDQQQPVVQDQVEHTPQVMLTMEICLRDYLEKQLLIYRQQRQQQEIQEQ